jgi:hypothetical protein
MDTVEDFGHPKIQKQPRQSGYAFVPVPHGLGDAAFYSREVSVVAVLAAGYLQPTIGDLCAVQQCKLLVPSRVVPKQPFRENIFVAATCPQLSAT